MIKTQCRRLQLHKVLIDILGTAEDKESRVYFQPPATIKMKYPCIIYKRNTFDTRNANDELYDSTVEYMVTVIDSNPDSELPEKILNLPLCRHNRHYTADGLNHDVFTLYY